MALSILNVGRQEDEALLRQVATTENESPSIETVPDPARAQIWASVHQPDLAVVDIRHLNGEAMAFIRRFRSSPECRHIPMLAVLSESDADVRDQALIGGADELIVTGPLDPSDYHVRILHLLALGAQRRSLREHRASEGQEMDGPLDYISPRECELFVRLGQFRDEATRAHILRIGKISRCVAEGLGLPAAQCDLIEVAAPMHDIGKIGIPDSILRKPGPLTQTERKTMETHTRLGYDVLKNSRSPYLQCGAEIALAHHEKFDGTGYPYGKRGEEIPLCARIVAVADVYDALRNHRPYKHAWPTGQVLRYLNDQSGKHFDPQCVDALATAVAAH